MLPDSLIQVDKRKELKEFLLLQYTHCKIIFISQALDCSYSVQIHMLLLALGLPQQSVQRILSSYAYTVGTSSVLQNSDVCIPGMSCLDLGCIKTQGHLLASSLQGKKSVQIAFSSFFPS